ncbi:MAG: GH92 family glycosyl hydrolase [Acidobacteriota bacterium]|nr:GH92 family glycosyl hydrolase [Acidobacteriota bacterium]
MATAKDAHVASRVDPFLGTDGGGNTIPGPSLPFGMIKPGPDVGTNEANSGWEPTGDINGFSQTHLSGTGGGPKYGNILVQPTVGAPQAVGYGSSRRNEGGAIGYYHVTLKRYPIDVEITTSNRAALYRFTYPAAEQANILFDAGHCLSWVSGDGEGQFIAESHTKIESQREVSGSSSVTGGWNKQPIPYTVYFFAQTDTPAEKWGTWRGDRLHPGSTEEKRERGGKTGAWLSFAAKQGQQVRLKIGISFVSVEQAKRNLSTEIASFDFDQLRANAVTAWDSVLNTIELQGATAEQEQMFYTALYHAMLMPTDRSGENPLWHSEEPYYDDFYAVWDTFRTSGPLLTLIAPRRQAAIVRSLVDIYRHQGWLPDARSGNFTGRVQGGTDADFVLADAYVKHLPGIDWEVGYEGLVKDAEMPPANPMNEGRSGLSDWKNLQYVSIEGSDRPASKHMEYAANDFEIALVAKGLGHNEDAAKYFQRSRNWENLWDENFEEGGVKGFIRPRHQDGSWKKDFTAMQSCSWGGDTFYEGNSWTYSLFVPQDVAGLIKKSGGAKTFIERLDAFFDTPQRYDVGNEPGFLAPYLYIWAGRHDKTAERVRKIIADNFHPGKNGLPGNDDSGAMSSWYAFGTIGIFPNAGQDVYLIGSPAVPSLTLHLANGKTFVIEAKNVSPANKYVIAAELNGAALTRAWLRHDEIANGGKLTLRMARAPETWPSGATPPSRFLGE